MARQPSHPSHPRHPAADPAPACCARCACCAVQGMVVTEQIMDQVAHAVGKPVEYIKRLNMYNVSGAAWLIGGWVTGGWVGGWVGRWGVAHFCVSMHEPLFQALTMCVLP